jgi:hypothetical protein
MKKNVWFIFIASGALGLIIFSTWIDADLSQKIEEKERIEAQNIDPIEPFKEKIVSLEENTAIKGQPTEAIKIETLSIKEQIANIEDELKQGLAIERLNAGLSEPKERQYLGAQLEKLDQLRISEIQRELASVESELAILELNHAERLHSFGVK